ncbi:hypothetical protein BDP27DRAFT_1235731 [Rhodocollybia butyracea]|uniref:DEAD/DEAH-box helicase domain-containing protein n=1 Tax=Rhodocollybia butyracea TaxID=206335 RepID=A0A9P5PD41_9AGAR|nr:hypothetical protein BDP27DRAFT_1235731 [Rhodocollybia butyracea]
MLPCVSFTSNKGINTSKSIVTKLIPKWKDGLHKIQLTCIPKILNLKDVFAIEATGGGKSALFGIPVVYPTFDIPICSKPVGIVVTPTKGLASNIVSVLMFLFCFFNLTCSNSGETTWHHWVCLHVRKSLCQATSWDRHCQRNHILPIHYGKEKQLI